ncbi:hypothetical protein LAG90_11205 [Marinilongibacter aquaticus]|uniref:hypothetical protein n=1 Tax=Marinilongibacter aquaticus TaxID=2975157 RepID=UPI0021BD5789|nr:hypothetical protein [Marinilongibacter aquaticus]UBM57386.1 hypothetical protein LAG90_11205 [Marinilongibacter aquaticus]
MKKLWITLCCVTALGFCQRAVAQHHHEHSDYNDREYSKPKKHNIFSKSDFGFLIGLNNYDMPYDMPDLDTWNSRYVALQFRKNHRLITGSMVDVALGTGLEIGWNNFMMKYDEQYFENGPISDFELVDHPLQKSKLVVNTLNIPIMLQFGFKESNYRIGVGAFGGVRINSYQKFQDEAGKFKEKGDYNLRQFNYGFLAEAGKGDFRLFAKYDMRPLFNDNNPVNANIWTVGIRL